VRLNVTTTSGCKGRCAYCPEDRFKAAMADRPRYLSASELCELLPNLAGTHFEVVSFGGFSEPFDNPEIVELVTLVSEQEFVDEIAVYSNGEAMTPATMRRLAGVRFGTVDISCHGFEIDTYRRTRSFIDPRAVRSNVMFLLENHANIDKLTISVSGPYGSEQSLAELEALCDTFGATLLRRDLHTRAGLLRIGRDRNDRSDDGGARNSRRSRSGPFRCAKFDFEKPVLIPGGDISLCCQDFALRYVVGNLHEETFAGIMSGSSLRRHVLDVANGRTDDPGLACYECVFCVPVNDDARA
jgi:uncharacterized Fe-S cluster-containing radical SAM superfamily protein